MAGAQGQCPGCGAPISFSLGASVSAVCQYCSTTVRRTDRGLENLGKVADLTPTNSLVAVGDSGSIGDQSFQVLGKVQLQHDMGGVWEEWYLGFSDGRWGWLAYAQGVFMVSWKVEPTPPVPSMNQMRVDGQVHFGERGAYRVVELKQATIASAQGELPFLPRTGETRYYADLHGPQSGFGTIDWGSGSEPVEVFLGFQLLESQLRITHQVERPEAQVHLEGINCPGCGAPLKLFGGSRIERVACQHCGTISESASQQIVARQQAARAQPLVPLGASGSLGGTSYTVIGFVQRSSYMEGETFSWDEYLLFGPGLGFRWLVDDEGTWRMATPLNAADVDVSSLPHRISYQGKSYSLRNQNTARVEYVIGEFYWKVQVGETNQVMDFEHGSEVLSREMGGNEVHYSLSPVVPWSAIAAAFGVTGAPSSPMTSQTRDGGQSRGTSSTAMIALIIVVLLVLMFCGMCVCVGGGIGSSVPSTGARGGGYYGGGWSSGK